MADKSKFLVVNPSPDNLDEIWGKINLQNTKNGPFEAVVALGDVLPESSKLPGVEVDTPVYFAEGKHGVSEVVVSGNLPQNLRFMSSMVNLVKLKSGKMLAFVSAKVEESDENLETALEIIKKNSLAVDLLVTYNWSKALARQKRLTLVGNTRIDQIVKHTKPRYHFAVGNERGRFLESNPFSWEDGTTSRFISLGRDDSGEKWFYAFAIGDDRKSEGLTLHENPYLVPDNEMVSKKRVLESNDNAVEKAPKQPKVVPIDKCFFCLSNPNVETHMIISIGKSTYLTVAKGPLPRTNKQLGFSGHIIIISIEHIPSIRSVTQEVIHSPIFLEREKFQKTISEAFEKASPLSNYVFFEVNRISGVHHHVQGLPVPKSLLSKFADILKEKTDINNSQHKQNHNLEFREFFNDRDSDLVKIFNECDYIMFTIYRGNEKQIFISKLDDPTGKVDLQFPRRVLASVMKIPKRVYWEKCRQSPSGEATEARLFKKFYESYDFTLEQNNQ